MYMQTCQWILIKPESHKMPSGIRFVLGLSLLRAPLSTLMSFQWVKIDKGNS